MYGKVGHLGNLNPTVNPNLGILNSKYYSKARYTIVRMSVSGSNEKIFFSIERGHEDEKNSTD